MDLENIETVLPGVVTKVGDGVVDCKTCIRKVAPNGVIDIQNLEIPKIPLMKLGGANAEITFPSKEGDQVLLVAFSRDSELWKKDYSDDVTPESCTGLSLSDFVAVPIIASGKAEGAAKIRVTEDGDIEMVPATGKRVVSAADLLVRGKVQATDDVQAGVTEAAGEIIATGGVSLQLHMHPTDAPGSASTPIPIAGG